MISVEQIRALEERIERALSFIANLKTENAELRSRLDRSDADRVSAEKRADDAGLRVLELEEEAAAFRKDQLRIEEGIIHALEKLDAFEDLVLRTETLPGNPAVKVASPVETVPVEAAPEKAAPKLTPKPTEVMAKQAVPARIDDTEAMDDVVTETADIQDSAASLPEEEPLLGASAPSPGRPAVDELDIF